MCVQIGFLTEWQLYAQKIEGDSWVGEKLDPGKIEKMSGMLSSEGLVRLEISNVLTGRLPIVADQQIGQLYELLQAIKKGESGDSGEPTS